MTGTVAAGILFLISALVWLLSFRSFREKGFLFNNAYLYASQKERESMDKKPHYRQSAIVFLLIGLVFFLNAIALLLSASWASHLAIAVMVAAIVYAIASSIAIEKKKK